MLLFLLNFDKINAAYRSIRDCFLKALKNPIDPTLEWEVYIFP